MGRPRNPAREEHERIGTGHRARPGTSPLAQPRPSEDPQGAGIPVRGRRHPAACRNKAFLTNGWSFLQAFLSWASLLRAIPDMFASLEEPGRTCDEQRYLRALRPSPHAWPSLRLDSEEQANEGPRPPHRLSGHASAWGLHGGRASWGAPPRPVAALPSLSCNSGWSDRDRDITRRGRSKTGTSRGPV